jgi:hypothetical protein
VSAPPDFREYELTLAQALDDAIRCRQAQLRRACHACHGQRLCRRHAVDRDQIALYRMAVDALQLPTPPALPPEPDPGE